MSYKIIVCCDSKNGIGKNNGLPWSGTAEGSADMRHFVKTTQNGIVCMGRNTWNSIPKANRPLKNRVNIVLSKSMESTDEKDSYVFNSLEQCNTWLNEHPDYKNWQKHTRWVIGGEQIYKAYLQKNWINEIVMTKMNKDYKCDRFFLVQALRNFMAPESYRGVYKYWYDNKEENQLLELMFKILVKGNKRSDRTGTGTISSFGNTLKYTMSYHPNDHSFTLPMLTTKRMWFKGIFEELMWFLNGQTDSKILEAKGVNIWKGNSSREFLDSKGLICYPEGENGPIYGKQWRDWNGIDQIANIVNGLKHDPFSRRHVLSAWNVSDLDKMSLVPCHVLYQFYVTEIKEELYLSCMLTQRSGDMFLGVPFNLTSVSLLTLLIATQADMKPHKIIHSIGDAHIYGSEIDFEMCMNAEKAQKSIESGSHVQQVLKQINRKSLPFPRVKVVNKKENIEDYKLEDLEVIDYVSYNKIQAKMAI